MYGCFVRSSTSVRDISGSRTDAGKASSSSSSLSSSTSARDLYLYYRTCALPILLSTPAHVSLLAIPRFYPIMSDDDVSQTNEISRLCKSSPNRVLPGRVIVFSSKFPLRMIRMALLLVIFLPPLLHPTLHFRHSYAVLPPDPFYISNFILKTHRTMSAHSVAKISICPTNNSTPANAATKSACGVGIGLRSRNLDYARHVARPTVMIRTNFRPWILKRL